MSNKNYEKEALLEHRFWLQILGDHGRFIYDSLSPSEAERTQKASYFIHLFDNLLETSRESLDKAALYELSQKAYYHAQELRDFKLGIIKSHLVGKIKIGLPPTFINHMVNEVEEYIRVLKSLLTYEIPTAHPLHYHKIWLPDASGHAGAIECGLDSIEKELIEKSRDFKISFNNLHIKSIEFKGYLRTCLQKFPALIRLNNQVESEISLFMKFLKEIEELRSSRKTIGTLIPLLADHMFREECYYLYKISKVSHIKFPDCNPAKPRI